jgi:hypothetical protein
LSSDVMSFCTFPQIIQPENLEQVVGEWAANPWKSCPHHPGDRQGQKCCGCWVWP